MSKRTGKTQFGTPMILAGICLIVLVAYSAMTLTSSAGMRLLSYEPLVDIGLGLTTISALIVIWRRLMRWRLSVERETCEHKSRMKALDNHSIVSILDGSGKITYVNDSFVKTFGYTENELVGADSSLIYCDGQDAQREAIRSNLLNGMSWEGELRWQTKTGDDVWTKTTIYPSMCDTGLLASATCVHTDLTEINKARRERDLRETLHLLHDEVYIINAETLRFDYLNKAAMDQFGWDEAEYATKAVSDALPEYDEQIFRERTAPLIAGHIAQAIHRTELFGRACEINMQFIPNVGGQGQFLAVCRDISVQREYQKKKDAFVSTVSHELRSPLTSITGGLDLVLSGATGDLPHKSRSLIEIAQRNARRLILIINDILDLEKISAGQMDFDIRPTDLSALIKEAAASNQAYYEKYGVSLQLFGVDAAVEAECDADRMFQVLNNLMSNAAKFSDKGSVVDITLDQLEEDTLITVQDYGMGIPKESLPTIFGRFIQVPGQDRKAKGGTGLGLNIVKAIAEHHGGSVTCESVEGEGTTFTVRIPSTTATPNDRSDGAMLEAAE